MKTAVQLRQGDSEAPRTELLFSAPHRIVAGRLGPVALFEPEQLVAFVLRAPRRAHLYIFRTLEVDDRLAAQVPGVSPHVRLLLDVSSAGRIRRARGLLAYLVRTGRKPAALDDAFYVRVSAALGGRLPPHKVLLSLLSPDEGVLP